MRPVSADDYAEPLAGMIRRGEIEPPDECVMDDAPAMGDGGPCLSCGGNDGYGPAPHHTPDCYFASTEDARDVR
jgi:hypothetical protein